MCKMFLRASQVWCGAGGRRPPPTGTTPYPKASAAGASFQATHLHIMLFNQAYEEMQIRDYITGRKQIAAIEKLDQKEGNLQRSEIAFSEGSLKSSETVAKDLIYVGRHGSCKLLYQVVTPGNTRAGTAILSSYYRPARRS